MIGIDFVFYYDCLFFNHIRSAQYLPKNYYGETIIEMGDLYSENYHQTLNNLTSAKVVIFDFFDNIIVNDEDKVIRKNRLELLQMLCKTFENYINFSKIESI